MPERGKADNSLSLYVHVYRSNYVSRSSGIAPLYHEAKIILFI